MRIVVLIIALIVSASLAAQDYTSLWGLKYGIGINEMEQTLLQKKGLEKNPLESRSDVLVYKDFKFSGEDVEAMVIRFVNNKFYAASLIIEPSSPSMIFSLYRKFKENLEVKYGKPIIAVEKFITPYYQGDGYEIQAIRNGKIQFICQWKIDKAKPRNEIGISITKTANLFVKYTNISLNNIVEKKEQARDIDDL